jgi:hypothetical protein
VTGPSASAAARSAGSSDSIRRQSGLHRLPLPGVIRRARPAAAVELSPGTGVTCSPPYRRAARPANQEVLPGQLRSRDPGQQLTRAETTIPLLDRPTAASIAPITPSRPHSSVIAAIPAFAVSARSGAPTRACARFRLPPRILLTR